MVQRNLTGQRNDLLKVVLPAASRGDLDAIKEIVAADAQWIHAIGPHNRTMLWEAARKGRFETVCFLIEHGADVEVAACYYSDNFVDISALCVARVNGHEDVAELLQEHGATSEIYSHAYLGETGEVAALLRKKPSLVNRDFRAKPRSIPIYEATPLHYAVAGSCYDVCKLLVTKGAEVMIPGGILLRWAVWRTNLEVIRLLLEKGADPNESGVSDWATNDELASIVAEFGFNFNIDMPNWIGFPALVDESRGNHNMPDDPARVVALLEKGANVNITDHKGKTALHRAAQAGFTKIGKVLIKAGADIEAKDSNGETPLFDAIRAAREETVRLLLKHGASVRAANHRGRTAFDIATAAKRPAIKAMAEIMR